MKRNGLMPIGSIVGFPRFALAAATATGAIGIVALLGWLLDIRILQSFYPGWVTMKPNTAFGLTLGGIALALHATATRSSRHSSAGRVIGVVVAIIGAATLSQYVLGVDFGIDQLLFPAPVETPPSPTPGRMAAVTAVVFVLIGAALTLTNVQLRLVRPAQPLAVAAGAIGLAALLGYVYGAISTVGHGHGMQIAFHTALAFVLLAGGVLALEARAGWITTLVSSRAGGALARRLLPLAFIVPVALGTVQSFGEWAGFGQLLGGAAMVAVLTMLAFGAVIWRTARALNEADAKWQAGEQERITMIAKAEASREREIVERAAREAAEQAVREKDEALTVLNLVLDSSPVGFALFDRELRVKRVNRAFTEMTGASSDGDGEQTVHDVVPEHAESVVTALRQVLSSGTPLLNMERSATGKSAGRSQHWLSSKYPVRSRDGETIGVGMTLVETTERKELEAQLLQAQKMEAIGQLAGGMAHDFNNVLTAIRSFGELVGSGMEPDHDLRPDVLEIIAAADRGTALTRQLLAFSRQQRLEPAVVDINTVAEGVTKLLSRLIGPDISCETSLSPSAGRVLADPGQLEQVIVNLAVNARDAMPEGGTLKIETSNVSLSDKEAARIAGPEVGRSGEYVVLSVSDTGHGIDRQTQSRIFDPFFTTKEAGKGTGLGLSTVYGIVTQSSGYVSVSSEVGRGTTFRVYLPRVAADADAAVAPRAASAPATGSGTVLIVDDDSAVLKVLTRVLTRAGFSTLSAASASEAQRLANENGGDIDLLMTDLMMPEMKGDELAQRVRAARPGIRVLYTSGYTDDAVLQRGLIRPGDPFLSKPFTLDEVVSKVREALAA